MYRQVGDRGGVAGVLGNLGKVFLVQGDLISSRAIQEESLAISRETGVALLLVLSLCNLAEVILRQGDKASARQHYLEARTFLPHLDSAGLREEMEGAIEFGLGTVAIEQGDGDSALEHFRKSLEAEMKYGHMHATVNTLYAIGRAVCIHKQRERGICLLGATEELRTRMGAAWSLLDYRDYERTLSEAHKALSEEAFTAAWEAGRAMTWEQAVSYALEETA